MSEKTSGRAAALLVAIAPFIYFFPAVRGQLVLCPDDGWLTNLPLRMTVAREVLAAHLPLWNPYIFSGFPLLGAAQAGVLLPLNWGFLILSAPVAMNLAVLSTYALAGVGAYVFARRSGSNVFGSVITGLVWQWSGFFVAHIGHTNMIQAASLLPWILWAIDGYAGYVGVTTLILAITAPLIKRDARTKFWSVAALVCLGLALGQFWPFGLYRAIFHVPLLNLFRVPARHLMEVDFALAMLAGRAVSAVPLAQNRRRVTTVILVVSLGVLAFTCLSVTVWRPIDFRLEQGLLHAPELFLPVILAVAGTMTLWIFVRGWQPGRVVLFVIVAVDLSLWGQSSGWRLSPSRDGALWQEPPAVAFLRQREADERQFRVLSLLPPADPNASYAASRLGITENVLTLQPNTYMMHRIQNAAGYDTFGLESYSHLADDMKLWGDLSDPERSLTDGREFDVLNVRYLIAKQLAADTSRW